MNENAMLARSAVPTSVRLAGAMGALEGALGVTTAAVLVYRAAVGGHEESTVVIDGYGTAAWFGVFGTAVLLAGIALLRGRRWGRGVTMMAQLLLLPVAYYVATSGWWPLSLGIAAVAIAGLYGVFHPTSVRWYEDAYHAGTRGGKDPHDGPTGEVS